MNIKKMLLLIPVGILLFSATAPSHARDVYGNVGYNDFPWSILIGYNDYGHGYNRGHRHGPSCGHGGHYYKKHHYKYKKRHYKRHHDYGYRDRHHYKHKRHHYKHKRHHYKKHHDRRHYVKSRSSL